MFDILLFDLDGTLTDPKEGITKCVQYALAACGVRVDDLDLLECFIGPPLVDAFSEFYGFDDKTTEFAIKKYRERFSTVGIFENELLPGAADMLREFKSRGKTVALATSKPQKFAERILEHFDIAKYFDVVCGCGFDGTLQTKAEVIAETMARLSNPDPARAVMIGDRKHDINGAKICGLKSIGLKLGYAEPGELEAAGADMIAKDFNELMDLIK